MINVVINYDAGNQQFKVFESSSDTILVSSNLTEALVNLSSFLREKGLVQDLLKETDISYHIDSYTMNTMIESNTNLLKRLKTAPTGFMISSQRFGTSLNSLGSSNGSSKSGKTKAGSNTTVFKGGNFTGKTGFKSSYKKFGQKT
jgi:hypothetical protein